jgi:hypothetical protein
MPVKALVAVAIGAALAAGPASALKECPFDAFQREQIIKAITEAADCRASYEVLSACQNNASGDVELAQIVIDKCQKAFPTANPRARRAYAKAQRDCDDKYAKLRGTMYVSAQAICRAKAALRFAK